LKKLFDLLALEGPIILGIILRIGGFRIVGGHGNLIANIVGEFTR
jgi:hypothetical protein